MSHWFKVLAPFNRIGIERGRAVTPKRAAFDIATKLWGAPHYVSADGNYYHCYRFGIGGRKYLGSLYFVRTFDYTAKLNELLKVLSYAH